MIFDLQLDLERSCPFCVMTAVLHEPGTRPQLPQPWSGVGDADWDRTCQPQHAVERVDSDVHLGRPALVRAGAQPVAHHLLQPSMAALARARFV